MKLSSIIVASIALCSSNVSAAPLNEERDLVCLAHAILINLLTLNYSEAFCFDYLNIQTSTILTTTTEKATTTTVLPAITTLTTLITGTNTLISETHTPSTVLTTSTLNVFETITEISTVTVTSTTTLAPQKRKRSAEIVARTVPRPSYLNPWKAAQISAACKCLNVPTPRVTSVITASETSTITSTPPVVTDVITTFALETAVTTIVDITTQVEVLTLTSTSTETSTTTTTAIVTETPVLVLKGCANPAIGRRGYALLAGDPLLVTVLHGTITLLACCETCWSRPNCVQFYWRASFTTATATSTAQCYSLIGRLPVVNPIPNPPATCPAGVDTLTRSRPSVGFYGVGHCDSAAALYW